MKKILLGLLFLLGASQVKAIEVSPEIATQKVKHHVVVQVNFNGKDQWKGVFGNIKNLKLALAPDGGLQVEIVAHGKGLELITSKDPEIVADLKALADSGDGIAACAHTCDSHHLTSKDLASYVNVVDSGVAEVVRRQEQGWSYLKGGSGF
jgi:uncharacterized protein